ncbi:MAG: hypothetical protein Q8L20_10835 [Gammaproteobacteria bacterium]|nr:hypothetical protein [Gammaproteobacteria bacterium]
MRRITMIVLALGLLMLTACSSTIDEMLGVAAEENASLCVQVSADSPNPMTNARASAKRIEIPASIDASTITTVEDLERLERVLCD